MKEAIDVPYELLLPWNITRVGCYLHGEYVRHPVGRHTALLDLAVQAPKLGFRVVF